MKASDDQVGGKHYKDMKMQPAEFIHMNHIGFLEGNVIKYVVRHATKGGKDDLLKARHYIDLLLEWQYGGSPDNTFPAVAPARLGYPCYCPDQGCDAKWPCCNSANKDQLLPDHSPPPAKEAQLCAHGYLQCKVCKWPS